MIEKIFIFILMLWSSVAVRYLLLALFGFLISTTSSEPYEMKTFLFFAFYMLSLGISYKLFEGWLNV